MVTNLIYSINQEYNKIMMHFFCCSDVWNWWIWYSVDESWDLLCQLPPTVLTPPYTHTHTHTHTLIITDLRNDKLRNGLIHVRVNFSQSEKSSLPRGGGGGALKFKIFLTTGGEGGVKDSNLVNGSSTFCSCFIFINWTSPSLDLLELSWFSDGVLKRFSYSKFLL